MKKIFLLIVIFANIAGCSKPSKRYHLEAEVISVEASRRLIVVKHGDIPGLMPAMTMQYSVADPKQIEKLQPGDKITADLVVSEDKGQLENITLVSKGNGTPSGISQHIPEKGDVIPDFTLTNQNGRPIHFHDFRGKVLLVTFIYTRCPLPDFCPRMNQNFSQIQTQLLATPDSQAHTAFLSISFDPQHDTPAVLKHYASLYNKPQKRQRPFDWQFAVPSAKDLPEIANFFGLVMQQKDAEIIHSLSTTLIGPDGKIQEWYDSNDWNPSEVAQLILQLSPKPS
ncbi:MAG TPA: SCO family protein [Verrucomicrobiae bacterium]|nr:SCO family protein [Verrucomicrobiae bacterium]